MGGSQNPALPQPEAPRKIFACGARLFIAHKNLADDAGEQVTEAEVQARLGAEMASARDGLVEVNFVCRVRGRATQLFDESRPEARRDGDGADSAAAKLVGAMRRRHGGSLAGAGRWRGL